MDQKKLNDAVDKIRDKTTDALVALYQSGPHGFSEEFYEAVRRVLRVRGVLDLSAYVPET